MKLNEAVSEKHPEKNRSTNYFTAIIAIDKAQMITEKIIT